VRDKCTIAEDRDRLLGVRAAVPALLDLFTSDGIHATWAVVGLLLAETKRELLARLPPAVPYARPALSPYAALIDVGDSERDDPFHFAASLVRRVAATPAQEIGTHTFSHYYCLEPGQTPAHFRADVAAALAITREKLGLVPRSIVFPRNQVSAPHVAVCGELGFRAYRANPDAWAYRPRPDDTERIQRRAIRLLDAYLPLVTAQPAPTAADRPPANVAASRYLRPYVPTLRAAEGLRERRLARELARAARERRIFHLWWHPDDFGLHLAENLAVLRRFLDRYRTLREQTGMETLTMGEAADRLLARRTKQAASSRGA
jgi:peptidoglycan/xylan/chitin deacetylase (PgdA/CDA1 family)